ncbi:cytochrome P450 [Actinomycetospora sp. TBRC 11914]|uniref:cytochrome P450 n=1 Tax=Actinomycetospora sp. TBRC 11914 TaxID=2729387 RepID=UPI00145EE784|nr:cytochrome P450 [Actinomycetospora sp. TBRC 11914]NMO91980.1 cytochrome P450 [Actinomycetospora sp. TBRC 11914]
MSVQTSPASGREYSAIDISGQEFWDATAEEREETFARLRREDPVSWQRPVENAVAPDPEDPGYWAVVRHEDIATVSTGNDVFVSGQGVLFDQLPPEFLEMTQSFLAMDNPRHNGLRKLVQKAFTPKRIQRISEQVEQAAQEVVDSFAGEPSGEIEFVERCAGRLPLRMFSAMFGVPEHLQEETAAAAQEIVSWADPEHLAGRDPSQVQLEAAQKLHRIAAEIVAERRQDPGEDLFTGLIEAEVDGQHLTDSEIGAFFVLLAVAGNDTTKHTSTLTIKHFTENPDQRDWLAADLDERIGTAVEEFVRYASPVMTFRRTAVTDTELGGRAIREGDKVVMFYSSGNRDADVFDDPGAFDLARSPNPHVGFGGGGTHYCLGNQLAKTMLRALFRQILTRVPDIHVTAEPELLGTNFIRGVKRQQVAFTPE